MKNRLIEKISGKQEIAKLNLLCFPYAGAGASVYYRWKEYFGNKVMIYAIQLPGRENRISEPMYASVDEIMPDLLEAVGEIVKEESKMERIEEFIEALKEKGIRIWSDNEKLRYQAAKGAMDSQTLEKIKEKKVEILEFLNNKSDIEVVFKSNQAERYEPFPLLYMEKEYLLIPTDYIHTKKLLKH